ncbi:hypothetical protein HY345_00795 [Candidatus Microgenomates bacterium]|nr:hypothetical protein [Candidatus Microgenomates bacterium]
MTFLEKVQYKLPYWDGLFIHDFLSYLSPLGKCQKSEITLNKSNNNFFPITSILFTKSDTPQVSFFLSDGNSLTVSVTNTTNAVKNSPHRYSHLSLREFIKRITTSKLRSIDHTGFNLPYFEGIHPKISELREKFKNVCLYHTFPKHLANAPWDFILPGTVEEIIGKTFVDYSLNRKPKIEIVSFDKSSTPLIQFDIQLEGKYKDWVRIFPEGIFDQKMSNIWVYLKNDFGTDICFVLNEFHNDDWSFHFAKDRLI